MPESFERCVRENGRVKRKRVNKTQWMNVCFKNGKSYAGEVHQYKKITKK